MNVVKGSALLVGYMRVLKAEGSQAAERQRQALLGAGVQAGQLYEDRATDRADDRPGLAACLNALHGADTLVVWKLDRLGRSLRHLVNTVHDLTARRVGLRVLTGQGAVVDTGAPGGNLVCGIFAALAEYDEVLVSERTAAGLSSARARGRPYKMTPAKLHLAAASMSRTDTNVANLCAELGITRQTLYRHVSPTGELRPAGTRLLTISQQTGGPTQLGGNQPNRGATEAVKATPTRDGSTEAGQGRRGIGSPRTGPGHVTF